MLCLVKLNYRQVLRPSEEDDLVKFLGKHSKPLVFDRHFYSLDWDRHNLQVNLVNMVREPVDRIVSQFYYLRSNKRWSWRNKKPPAHWFDKDFDTCVLEGDPECEVGKLGLILNITICFC